MPIIDFRQGTIALLLMIACSACKGDKAPHGITKQPVFSNAIKTLIHDMAAENVVMGSAVGFAGIRPEQWDRYEKLSRLATDEELTALTDDTNVVVRCYAFQAMVERRRIDPFPVLLRHLSDTAYVHTLYGCIGNTQKVGDFYLACMGMSGDGSSIRRLNKKQQAIIDSILIFGKINLVARDELLNRVPVESKYYNRLRGLAMYENSMEAVIGLAKFKKAAGYTVDYGLAEKK
jgi:hypothetical protein